MTSPRSSLLANSSMNLFDLPSLSQRMLGFLFLLESEDGIYASSKEEVYGCIFGRDSAITILKILRVVESKNSLTPTQKEHLLALCHKTLVTLIQTQGKKIMVESGEEPGKFVHEFRKKDYEELINRFKDWYIYPDGTFKNYNSLDSTPLVLLALFRFWQVTQNMEFVQTVLPAVQDGLRWIMDFGDRDNDYLLEYVFQKDKRYNGLKVQSWMDSLESVADIHGVLPPYPIAPVEVQGYAWLALKVWISFFSANKNFITGKSHFVEELLFFAQQMKKRFHETFMIKDQNLWYVAQVLDGEKRQIKTITANPLLLLWASFGDGNNKECILERKYIADVVKRGFASDMFEPDAGIRTMSTLSPTFRGGQDSYHNGSFWPFLNGLIWEGLETWGYFDEAEKLKIATLSSIEFFKTPIELYIKSGNGALLEYKNNVGQVSCRNQAWTAASILAMTVEH